MDRDSLRRLASSRSTRCCATRAIEPPSSASGGRASPGARANRTSRGSTIRSAFSIIGTRTGSTPIICGATASASPFDVTRDYVNDLFTKESITFIDRKDRRPFFVYLNYTVPHAELRVPESSLAEFRGKFPERPYTNPAANARPTGANPDGASLGYRSQPDYEGGIRVPMIAR